MKDNEAACVAGREFHDEWIDELCALISEGDESLYSNPEGAVEAIILDCFRAYKAERDAAHEKNTRLRAAVEGEIAHPRLYDGYFCVPVHRLRAALAVPTTDDGAEREGS